MDFKEKLNELDKFITKIAVGRVKKDGQPDKRYKNNWLHLHDKFMGTENEVKVNYDE